MNIQLVQAHDGSRHVYVATVNESTPVVAMAGPYVVKTKTGSFRADAVPGTKATYIISRLYGEKPSDPSQAEDVSIHKYGDFGIYVVGFFHRIVSNPEFSRRRDLIQEAAFRG
ncbi:uncharacterized protein LOC144139511 [Haemaphysalis longicornis]